MAWRRFSSDYADERHTHTPPRSHVLLAGQQLASFPKVTASTHIHLNNNHATCSHPRERHASALGAASTDAAVSQAVVRGKVHGHQGASPAAQDARAAPLLDGHGATRVPEQH